MIEYTVNRVSNEPALCKTMKISYKNDIEAVREVALTAKRLNQKYVRVIIPSKLEVYRDGLLLKSFLIDPSIYAT